MPAGASWCSYDAGTKGFTGGACWEESRRVETCCAQTFLYLFYLFFLLLHRLFWGHHSACCSVYSFWTYLSEMPSKNGKRRVSWNRKGICEGCQGLVLEAWFDEKTWELVCVHPSRLGDSGQMPVYGMKISMGGWPGEVTHPPTHRQVALPYDHSKW